MIKININTHEAKVVHIDNEAEGLALKKALTFIVPGFKWTRKYKSGFWDGTYCFLNRYNMSFPTGLLEILPSKLAARVIRIDNRAIPVGSGIKFSDLTLEGIELRDYQSELIGTAVEKERCIIQSCTNAGKSEIAAGIMKCLGVKTLFLTHIDNLCRQTRERLELRLGVPVGMVNAEYWAPEMITVGMIPTLYNRVKSKSTKVLDFLNSIDALFLDEVHHLSAESWLHISKKCPAYYRYGLSATPVLRDAISNLKLIGETGGVVDGVSNKELIERGISARPTIYIVSNRFIGEELRDKTYQMAYRLGIETNQYRNKEIALIAQEKVKQDKRILILVNTIRHQKDIERSILQLNKSYILPSGYELLNGGTDVDSRMRVINYMKKGRVKVIIATPIFDEGMDMPEVNVLILGGGGKSQIKLLQRLGRGMRKKTTGSNTVEVYDFEDSGQMYLMRHAKRRTNVYNNEGFNVKRIVR